VLAEEEGNVMTALQDLLAKVTWRELPETRVHITCWLTDVCPDDCPRKSSCGSHSDLTEDATAELLTALIEEHEAREEAEWCATHILDVREYHDGVHLRCEVVGVLPRPAVDVLRARYREQKADR
jgi:hypothetical protein